MSERKLYQKFRDKIKAADPLCFVYKIPDWVGGGKRPFDFFLLTKSVAFAVEFKSKGKKATKYQDFMLEEFKNAEGVGCVFTEGQDLNKFVADILRIRDLINKNSRGRE